MSGARGRCYVQYSSTSPLHANTRMTMSHFEINRLLALSARIIRRLSTADRMITPRSQASAPPVRIKYRRSHTDQLHANTKVRVPQAGARFPPINTKKGPDERYAKHLRKASSARPYYMRTEVRRGACRYCISAQLSSRPINRCSRDRRDLRSHPLT